MTSDALPLGLLMATEDQYRRFEIASMTPDMYQLSQNFFTRYRLTTAMNFIVKYGSKKVELAGRTVDFFVDSYMTECATGYKSPEYPNGINVGRRLIFHPDDSQKGESSTRPRRPRVLHRAEVLGMFAGNAEWILKHQIDLKQKKIIDLPSWATFCKGLVSIRQRARQKGVRWGLAFNDDGEADGSENEVDFARAGLTKDQHTQKISLPATSESDLEPTAESEHDELEDEVVVPEIEEHEYEVTFDSDFSVETTPPPSDSTDDEVDKVVEWPNPEITHALPHAIFYPPKAPGMDHQWRCAVPKCTYSINMLKLTDNDVQDLLPEDKRYLARRNWHIRDERVHNCFNRMVHNHYIIHIQNIGGRLVGRQGQASFLGFSFPAFIHCNTQPPEAEVYWENPKAHAPWPQELRSQHRNVNKSKEIVKEESYPEDVPMDYVDDSPKSPLRRSTRRRFKVK
ncbi:hypothetical protein HWV62_28431 [Athelia sp. TMB]|nr:hypothetical protein HWV62_28431 [Athelia sp. TMB]